MPRTARRSLIQATEAGAQIVCLQEIFNGSTIRLTQDAARKHRIALIVPIYEREQEGVYYNAAAVLHNAMGLIWVSIEKLIFHRSHQPGRADANGYTKVPWNIGVLWFELLLRSARTALRAGSRDKDEVLTADLDLDMIAEVRRTGQFFRDRRPDMYNELVKA